MTCPRTFKRSFYNLDLWLPSNHRPIITDDSKADWSVQPATSSLPLIVFSLSLSLKLRIAHPQPTIIFSVSNFIFGIGTLIENFRSSIFKTLTFNIYIFKYNFSSFCLAQKRWVHFLDFCSLYFLAMIFYWFEILWNIDSCDYKLGVSCVLVLGKWLLFLWLLLEEFRWRG